MSQPITLRIVGDNIELGTGEVVARINPGATPSRLQTFIELISDISDFGHDDEVTERLFPSKEEMRRLIKDWSNELEEAEPELPPVGSITRAQAEADLDQFVSNAYDEILNGINHNVRNFTVNPVLALHLIRKALNLPTIEGRDTPYITDAADEYSYRQAVEAGEIGMDYEE